MRRAVELTRGDAPRWWMDELAGRTVLIKPAHNSDAPYPFTASAESTAAIAAMCLERGARRVVVADCMGIEHTCAPGNFRGRLESPFGRILGWDPADDATLAAMHASGMIPGVRALIEHDGALAGARVRLGLEGAGPDDKVVFTSFREHNWERFDLPAPYAAAARMHAGWVRNEVAHGTSWRGEPDARVYFGRLYDALRPDVPGMWLPRLFDQVDLVVNLTRVSTHIWSHWTGALKNWIGVMRPDDRAWLHQLNYLTNRRAAADNAARVARGLAPIAHLDTEPPYHEMLAELHLATAARTTLCVADGSLVVRSGGPDESDAAPYPARAVIAAGDMVSAEVAHLALIRTAIRRAHGACAPQPESMGQLVSEYLHEEFARCLRWHPGRPLMRGADAKLCDEAFSNWDWLAIRRARELRLGAQGPEQVRLRTEGLTRALARELTAEVLARGPALPVHPEHVPALAARADDEPPLAARAFASP